VNRTARARPTAAVAAMVFATVVACGSNAKPGPGAVCPKPNGITSVGEAVPAKCTLERLDGGTLTIGNLKGKPAVLNFWASWCTYCVAEMPAFERAHVALAGRVTFVGADLLEIQGETRTAAQRFAGSTGVRYALVYDTGAILYGYFGGARPTLPVTIFVKSNGIVAFRQFGPLTESKILALVRTKLGVA
jgi:thiol-disulfide isomerase/thioredoxin